MAARGSLRSLLAINHVATVRALIAQRGRDAILFDTPTPQEQP